MNILLTVIVGFIGYKIALKLKVPAPAMIGSMLVVGNLLTASHPDKDFRQIEGL